MLISTIVLAVTGGGTVGGGGGSASRSFVCTKTAGETFQVSKVNSRQSRLTLPEIIGSVFLLQKW